MDMTRIKDVGDHPEILKKVLSYNPGSNISMLEKAIDYAYKSHEGQKRSSGEPYITHPLAVADILTDYKVDDATIAVALLHDTIEDTTATRAELDDLFGRDIGQLVQGLTKLKKLDFVMQEAKQGENLRKLLLAISSDIRVLFVKLADRLHNMRTLDYVRSEKRQRISRETLDIYAPLAARMGMKDMCEELEELSFRHLNPEAYNTIVEKISQMRESTSATIDEVRNALDEKLRAANIKAEVTSREKKPYSIFTKLQDNAIAFEQLSDFIGFRIIVDTIGDCYAALGLVHTTWKTVPGRFKDYISTPKDNDYRSIHTTIIGPYNQRAELQIRTQEMHQIAEYGIAAHALYKSLDNPGHYSLSLVAKDSKAYAWLRKTVETLANHEAADEFLENTKLELFQDQVFCFTPKGRIIALPKGATPIDFAYAVHTDVGDSCVGCKINGRLMPVITRLQNGDEVEIICSHSQTPPPAWEQVVQTGKARSAIRRATRAAQRAQYCELGRKVLERYFENTGRVFEEDLLEKALSRLSRNSCDDVYISVGRTDLEAEKVFEAVESWKKDHPDQAAAQDGTDSDGSGWFGLKKVSSMKFRVPGRRRSSAQSIPIRGLQGDLPVQFHAENGAVPGDRIVGIHTPGEGVTIYPIHAQILSQYDDQPERWLDVRWDLDATTHDVFPVRIEVTALNAPGTLAKICEAIGERKTNIDNIMLVRRGKDFHDMLIDIEVRDVQHLNDILSSLRRLDVVSDAMRHYG
jgi:guanosine-3',5'-bis(diphosphate) 3'-pyrophosphohydrolase